MTQANPSLSGPEFLPRVVAGWRKAVLFDHPATGPIFLPATQAEWQESLSPQFTEYAVTPPTGPKQRTLHARGTKEISWSLAGDLTRESSSLLNLLHPQWRGVALNELQIQQGTEGGRFTASTPYALPWESVSFSAAQHSPVTFSISGKSTVPASSVIGLTKASLDHPIPSWSTGNSFVKAWSITHSVSLSPNWANDPQSLPSYYRPGSSRWQVQLTTVRTLMEHTIIKFVAGAFELMEAIVTSRSFQSGDRTAGFHYQVTIENVRPDRQAFLPSAATITIPVWPESLWPGGL